MVPNSVTVSQVRRLIAFWCFYMKLWIKSCLHTLKGGWRILDICIPVLCILLQHILAFQIPRNKNSCVCTTNCCLCEKWFGALISLRRFIVIIDPLWYTLHVVLPSLSSFFGYPLWLPFSRIVHHPIAVRGPPVPPFLSLPSLSFSSPLLVSVIHFLAPSPHVLVTWLTQ